MGYKISLVVNCYKATDYSDLAGVSLLVYHEGENFSIMTLTADAAGYAFETLDRSQYQATDTLRVKAYAEKTGYVKCCVKAHYEGVVIGGDSVHNHSYNMDVLMIEAEPEPEPEPVRDYRQGAWGYSRLG